MSRRITVVLPDDVSLSVERMARDRCVSLSSALREIISHAMRVYDRDHVMSLAHDSRRPVGEDL